MLRKISRTMRASRLRWMLHKEGTLWSCGTLICCLTKTFN